MVGFVLQDLGQDGEVGGTWGPCRDIAMSSDRRQAQDFRPGREGAVHQPHIGGCDHHTDPKGPQKERPGRQFDTG